MIKKKIDIFGYLKNFGIVSATAVTLYGGFKLVDSVLRIVPVVENIQQVQSEQGAQISDIQNELFDVRMIQGEQIKQLESISKKHNELLVIIPQVTKENMRELFIPLQEEIKKNEYQTQSNMSGKGAS